MSIGRLLLAGTLLVAFFCQGIAAQSPDVAPQNPDLARELRDMGEKDQRYQPQMFELLKNLSDPETARKFASVAEKQNELNDQNIKRLEEIIAKYGWPTKTLVGKEAAQAAFLIVQHSDLSYQKKYFSLIKEAAKQNEARPSDAAMLEDRILTREGKKQIYGTQVHTNDVTKKPELFPIEDEENVDSRRAAVGMQPLREYLKVFGIDYKPIKQP